jgi:hypothetical protein
MSWREWTPDEWMKKGQPYTYAKVWKTALSTFEVRMRGIKPYVFAGRIGRTGKETKAYFNSKSEAKEFAKRWMAKN